MRKLQELIKLAQEWADKMGYYEVNKRTEMMYAFVEQRLK